MDTDRIYTVLPILARLARLLGTETNNGRLEIPAKFGKEYAEGFILNEHIRLVVSNYILERDIAVENPEVGTKKIIFFKFRNIFPQTEVLQAEKPADKIPSVLIGTSRIHTDEILSIHSDTATINIEIDAGYLNRLFDFPGKSPVLQSLLQNAQPLLFEQVIYPSVQKIIDEMLTEKVDEPFRFFFLRVKSEELIGRLLMELEKRDEQRLYPLNNHDIQTIYKVKEQLLTHIKTPPAIRELAAYAHMSPSKLKRLFRQVFGDSIFSYYQHFRMQEAARLLKEEKLSVSEVGYQMGFTNLSHFSRVFHEHIGMKPKQYTKSF
ncbi:MAG: AraC family transcriptional regulator [Tannerellaceae bacterium]|nr:AraC family transcriptional regulator [Tannerellaceae bacterium]MCD8263536.1 AraC family transcriptional regulator [Tannerellaceae bacterium]